MFLLIEFLSLHSLLILHEEVIELCKRRLQFVLGIDYLGFFFKLELFFQRCKSLHLIGMQSPYESNLHFQLWKDRTSLFIKTL